jgi:hypothetical protein
VIKVKGITKIIEAEAEKLNIAVPKTFCFPDKAALANSSIAFPCPCYLKASEGVSGIGIYRCENRSYFEQALTQFEDNLPLQVQEELQTDMFLSLQYEVNDKGLRRLAVTEQVLDGFAHAGNRFPACYEPWESVEPIAKWLFDHGMQGIFAFDLGVVKKKCNSSICSP